MERMYKCKDCGELFSSPVDYTEDCTPGGSFEGGSFVNHYSACPYCGGAYTTVHLCYRCDEVFVDDDEQFCDSCKESILEDYHNGETLREDELEFAEENYYED